MATTAGATTKDPLVNQFKVKLVQAGSYVSQSSTEPNPGNYEQKRGRLNTTRVEFDVSPDLTESRAVNYKSMNPIHMPGQIFVYGSTSSRTFSLSGIKLISRTIAEATRNMQTLWTLRGWTMPYFGEGSSTLGGQQASDRRGQQSGTLSDNQKADVAVAKARQGQELLGKPPEVLLFSAYSSEADLMSSTSGRSVRRFPTNIDRVPVVITNLSIPYPSDVDYIPDENGQPIPRVMMVDIQLQETRAPREFATQFSLQDFRKGILSGF